MEILIMEISSEKTRYAPIYSDNDKIKNLGMFFWTYSIDEVLEWAKDPEYDELDTELMTVELEKELIKIKENFFDYTMEDLRRWDEQAFEITLDKFTAFLEQWKLITQKRPHFVIIKKDGDDIYFEEDYKEYVELDLSQVTQTEEFYNKMCNPPIKENLFYGGFHLKNCEENNKVKLKNREVGDENVLSFDIEFNKDFTFNHAFFPETWDINKLKEEISRKLAEKNNFLKDMVEKDSLFFDIKAVTSEISVMRIILNKNLKIISCYPIFEEI